MKGTFLYLSLWFNDSRTRNLIIFSTSYFRFSSFFTIHALTLCQMPWYKCPTDETFHVERSLRFWLKIWRDKITQFSVNPSSNPQENNSWLHGKNEVFKSLLFSLKTFLAVQWKCQILTFFVWHCKGWAKIYHEQLQRRHNRMIHLHHFRVVKTRSKQ